MQNIEIKARYKNLDRARELAKNVHAKYMGSVNQIDTYFVTKSGRFKLRECGDEAHLIPYDRASIEGPKKSEYLLIAVKEPEKTKQLLDQLLGTKVVVNKTREIYMLDNVRVHLDQVQNLGNFIEFEAVYKEDSQSALERETSKVREIMELFEISQKDLIRGSYQELVLGM